MANKRSPKRQAIADMKLDVSFTINWSDSYTGSWRSKMIESVKGYKMSNYCEQELIRHSLEFTADDTWRITAAIKLLKKQASISEKDIKDLIQILFGI